MPEGEAVSGLLHQQLSLHQCLDIRKQRVFFTTGETGEELEVESASDDGRQRQEVPCLRSQAYRASRYGVLYCERDAQLCERLAVPSRISPEDVSLGDERV